MAFQIRIPSMRDFLPGSWPQARPLLAATKTGEQWRFAWFVPANPDEKVVSGLVVMESPAEAGATASPISSGPLLTGLENGWRLNFSHDGRFLTIQQRMGGRNQVRIFDLERKNAISQMTKEELRKEACEIAAFGGVAKLESFEIRIFFGNTGSSQTCDGAKQ